ncbi:hypothetical protein Tco_1378527 [Tanacetum coccineum]
MDYTPAPSKEEDSDITIQRCGGWKMDRDLAGAEMGFESEMKRRCLDAEIRLNGGDFGAEIAAQKGGFGR